MRRCFPAERSLERSPKSHKGRLKTHPSSWLSVVLIHLQLQPFPTQSTLLVDHMLICMIISPCSNPRLQGVWAYVDPRASSLPRVAHVADLHTKDANIRKLGERQRQRAPATRICQLYSRCAAASDPYSPMTYVHPSKPIHTSCTCPAPTSILSPAPYVVLIASASSGYVMVSSPLRIRWVVSPRCECGL